MDVKGACSYLNISRATLYKLTKLEGLPYIKLRGAIRFYEKDILEFIDRKKITVSNPQHDLSIKSR